MDQLWSPWRMKYIQNHEPVPGCIFCTALDLPDGPGNLILARGETAFVMLNRYPYTSGHLMVVPYQHAASFELLEPAARAEIMELLTRAVGALRAVYSPQGFNVGANIGAAASVTYTASGNTSLRAARGLSRDRPRGRAPGRGSARRPSRR